MLTKINNLLLFSILIHLLVLGESRKYKLKPIAENSESDDIMKEIKEVQNDVDEIVGSTYKWAKDNYPLTLRILQITKDMSGKQLAKIPSSKYLLKVLNDSVHLSENVTDYIKKHSNQSLFELMAENSNMTKGELKLQSQEMTRAWMSIPIIKQLIRDVMLTKVDDMPFGVTLMHLFKHLGNEVHVSQLNDPVVVAEMFSNVTQNFQPFIEMQLNKTLPTLKEKYDSFFKSEKDQVKIISEFAKNVSETYSDYFKRSLIHYFEQRYKN